VLNLINNDHFENVDVDALDSEITEDDIIKAIAKLKPEKRAESDNIIGDQRLNGLDEIQIGCLLVYLHLRTKIINVRLVY
jgi:hypothetical protein